MKMKNRINTVTLYSFLTLIFMISIFNLFSPVSTFSNNENRSLGQLPQFSLDSLFKGTYTPAFEKYIQDQFIFRDQWIMIKAVSNQVLLKLENNGVYIAKDHQLINQFILMDTTKLMQNVEYLNRLKGPVSLLVIPTASEIDKDKLALFSYNTDQVALIDQLTMRLGEQFDVVDIVNTFSGKEDLYFKTDHHWNETGAYLAYQAYCQSLNIMANNYTFETVSTQFKGTLFSKSGLFFYPTDPIVKAKEIDEMEVVVKFEDGSTFNHVYFENNLDFKDQYTYYLDGNHAFVEIENPNTTSNETLLVVKDSYAHLFVPYLVPHYKKIIMIDLRYYKSPLSALIETEGVDRTLVLYSLENLASDSNLAFIK